MKLCEVYYHQNSEEIWDKIGQKNWLLNLVHNPSINVRRGITKTIREHFKNELAVAGWLNEIKLSMNTDLTVSAKKNNLAIQIQTGNICRASYDLLKFQYLYLEGDIQSSVLIVPSKDAAKKIGSNIAHYDRLKNELQLFKKIITIPLILLSFD